MLAGDRVPLYIRLHYLCNDGGFPRGLVATVGHSDPPLPEEEDDHSDGLYAVRCVAGARSLANVMISSMRNVKVCIEPSVPESALRMNKVEFLYCKHPEWPRIQRYRVAIVSSPAGQRCDEDWQVAFKVEKDGAIAGGGNALLSVKQQVRMDFFFNFDLTCVIMSSNFLESTECNEN